MAISRAIGNGKGAILTNHGLLTFGSTVDLAAHLFTLMENCCEVQLLADSGSTCKEKSQIRDEEAGYTEYMIGDNETLYTEFQPDYEMEVHLSKGDFLCKD